MSAAREKVVYGHTLESLLRVLGQPLLPEHIEGLQALGVNARQLEAAYPLEQYSQVLDFIATQLGPERSPEEARFALGRAFLAAFRRTTMGKAVHAWTSRFGPYQTLDQMSRSFRSANNFTETRLRTLGPGQCELWFNQAGQTDFFRGLLTEALESEATPGLRVSVLSRDADGGVTFLITWTELEPR